VRARDAESYVDYLRQTGVADCGSTEHPERAVFYPEDERFLIDREEHADHFEVVHLGPLDRTSDSEDAGVRGLLRRLADWWLSRGVTTSRREIKTVGRLTPHGFTYVRLP